MSATDELRRLLDERGVGYSTKDSAFRDITYWPASNRVVASYSCSKYSETENGVFKTQFTPKQAIAATLGRDREAELEALAKDLYENAVDFNFKGWIPYYRDRFTALGIEVKQ